MKAFQIISPNIPAVLPQDTIGTVLAKMDKVQHLPLIDDEGKYVCLLDKKGLELFSHADSIKEHLDYHWEKICINDESHFYTTVKFLLQNNVTVLPIIDSDNNYIGSVEELELLSKFFKNTGLEHPGGIIVLEIEPIHYSLSEIARICESNDAQIINLQITSQPQRQMLEVTLKTNTKDLDAVIAGFERFEYNITEVYGDMHYSDALKKRYDLLMNYINM